jgi:hypothetical protein
MGQFEEHGFNGPRKDSVEEGLCNRARLQSWRKTILKRGRALAPASFVFQLFAIPQWLKPEPVLATFGTTEVVP